MELTSNLLLLASHARPQRSEQLVDFANGPLAKILEKEEKAVAAAKKQQEGVKPKSILKSSEEKTQTYGPEKPPWMVQNQPNPYDPPNLQPKEIQRIPDDLEKTNLQITEASESKKEESEPKSIITETLPEAVPHTSEEIESFQDRIPETASIPKDELLELQLIAQDDDESDFDAGDDWEYHEEDYNHPEDEDESEDEFGRTRGSLFPFALPETIQKSIEEKRRKNVLGLSGDGNASSTIPRGLSLNTSKQPQEEIEPIETTKSKAKHRSDDKRRVTFAEEISVREFEKDPREVHGEINPMQSLYKAMMQAQQEMMENQRKQGLESKSVRDEDDEDDGFMGTPSRNISVEEELLQKLYPDEKEPVVMAPPEKETSSKPVKVSRFKAARMASESSTKSTSLPKKNEGVAVSSSIVDRDNESEYSSPISSTIIEREAPVEKEPARPHKEAQKQRLSSSSSTKGSARASTSSTSKPQTLLEEQTFSANNNKPRVSRFKAQKQKEKSKPSFPTSNRIQELSSNEVQELEKQSSSSSSSSSNNNNNNNKASTPALSSSIPSFKNVTRYPSTFTSKQTNKPQSTSASLSSTSSKAESAVVGEIQEQAEPSPQNEQDPSARVSNHGVENIRPGLASGMKSLFPASVLAKADEYYQQSLLTEEEFIRAHLGNEEEAHEQEALDIAAERERYKEEQKQAERKRNEYKSRPIMEDELIERAVAPHVDGRGMGFVPDKHLKKNSNNTKKKNGCGAGDSDGEDEDYDDDDEDYTVSRAEIAREYQKLRQLLMFQTGGYGKSLEELEVEPIEEEGQVRRPSRFKAARLSTRRV